uniref:MutS_IV domain-containing protein n=1 Tax=Strongyloides papillosus TaxID=174720 RepID=A0A0N5CBN6_STREA
MLSLPQAPLKEIKKSLDDFVNVIHELIDTKTSTAFKDYRVAADIDKHLSEINETMEELEKKAKEELQSLKDDIKESSINIKCSRHGFVMVIKRSKLNCIKKAPNCTIIKNVKGSDITFLTTSLKIINEEYVKCLNDYWTHESPYVKGILEMVYKKTAAIKAMFEFVSQLDVFLSLAVFVSSSRNKFVRPQILDHTNIEEERVLQMTQLRHPVVETSPNVEFIPNDIKPL